MARKLKQSERERHAEPDAYAREARARWGHTAAYREAQRRTSGLKEEDWRRIRAAQERIEHSFGRLLADGVAPDEDGAVELAELARLHIDDNFYPCSRDTHGRLAEMYETDSRFKAHFNSRREGLAAYVANAIRANVERHSESERLRGEAAATERQARIDAIKP